MKNRKKHNNLGTKLKLSRPRSTIKRTGGEKEKSFHSRASPRHAGILVFILESSQFSDFPKSDFLLLPDGRFLDLSRNVSERFLYKYEITSGNY